MTIPHLPTVTAGTVRHAAGTASTTWSPPIPLNQARDWAHMTADGETIHSASFTHLDGSVSPMYVTTRDSRGAHPWHFPRSPALTHTAG